MESRFIFLTMVFTSAMMAGAARAEDPSLEPSINLCVEMRERIYQCRDEFAEAFVNHHSPPPERRAALKAKALEEITADGSGPLEPRRQVCADMAKRGMKPPSDKLPELRKALAECSAKSDCQARVDCLMPVIKPMVGKGKSVKR
jgi:hypothetical protein